MILSSPGFFCFSCIFSGSDTGIAAFRRSGKTRTTSRLVPKTKQGKKRRIKITSIFTSRKSFGKSRRDL